MNIPTRQKYPDQRILIVDVNSYAYLAPFAVADLAADEDVELRIFIDKYLVEVFVNGRQAVIAAYMGYKAAPGLNLYTYGGATTIK